MIQLGRAMTRRALAGAVLAGALAVATVPVGAEPNFGGVRYLTALPGSSLVDVAPFGSLSCVSTSCAAAGAAQNAVSQVGAKAAVVESSSGVWAGAQAITLPGDHVAPNGSDGFSDALLSVTCWQVGDCVAVGQYGVSKNFGLIFGQHTVPTPMVATETNGTWASAVAISLPTAVDTEGTLSSVSCPSAGNCTAVGNYITIDESTGNFTYHSLVVTESAGTWATGVTGPDIAGSSFQIPISISCTDANDCTYVVESRVGTTDRSYSVSEIAGTWGSPVAFTAPAGKMYEATSVSCATSTGCVSVGWTATNSHNLENGVATIPAFSLEHAGSWSPVGQLPQPMLSPLTNGGGFFSVNCPSATECVAVGTAFLAPSGNFAEPMAATLSNDRWSSIGLVQAPLLAGSARATNSSLLSVSCTATTNCAAVGGAATGTITTSTVNNYSFFTAINPVLTPTLPSAPLGVHAGVVPGSATILWQPPIADGGSPIVSFKVTAVSPGRPTRICVSVGLTCKLAALTKGHAYHVTVQARSAVGYSKATLPVTFVAH